MDHESWDDLQLLRGWQAGDAQCGDVLVRRHFVSVLRFFANKVPALAEDLTQRVFLSCAERRQELTADAGFRAYLFGMVRHVFLTHLRKTYVRTRAAGKGQSRKVDPPTGLDTALGRSEIDDVVRGAMRELPLDYRITLELHYWEDLDLIEIAAVTEVAVGTVKSRLSRGRDLVAQRLRKRRLRREIGPSTARDLGGRSELALVTAPRPRAGALPRRRSCSRA